MAKKSKTAVSIPIDSLKHQDSRTNIPTEELRDFVRDEENKPKTILYPRDPSLDPQLVWKGKDEQDQHPLEVPAVPIYIQEKIHPQAIIEDFRRSSPSPGTADRRSPGEGRGGGSAEQLALFADFNGLPAGFDQRVDFYHHDGHWSNRMILGDSLLVMTSLAEKEGLKGKVQTIYFDPPYGIKFGSNWQVSTRKRDVKDGKAEDATRQPEQVRAFRDTWKLGIHSYLSYLRDRLAVARELLTESGSVFVQIGDENVHLVRCVLDEVFGADNFCVQLAFQKTGAFDSKLVQRNFDLILWYAKAKDVVKHRPLFNVKRPTEYDTTFFDHIELPNGERRQLTEEETKAPDSLPTGCRLFARNPLNSEGWIDSLGYEFNFEGFKYRPPSNRHWTTTQAGMDRLRDAARLIRRSNTLRFVRYWDDYPARELGCVWTDTGTGGFFGDEKFYVVQTDTRVVARCLLMTTDPGDLVLDPTCGSGTTAYVAEQWGRRWITTDTSRVALALARTRLMTGRFPFYLLADSPEGAKKEAEVAGTPTPALPRSTGGGSEGDIRKGFVYQRVPHVTLKSIANNPDIVEGMSRAEIDRAILKHAETETLYDKPYEDKGRLRVTGPFTVESLSPHRTISVEEKQ
jgi:adenine-specific DNA-methyltransferase